MIIKPTSRLHRRAPALFENLDELVELLPPYNNGLRLPRGFQSRVIARSGRVVETIGGASACHWHNAPDDGAGAVCFDAAGNIVSAFPILGHTNNNCAGGKPPWRTRLSCEEVERGLVYECDPFGRNHAAVRPALGCFRHEAVAVDQRRGHLYLTEDENDGAFYRFVPAGALPDLGAGTLQVAEIVTGVAGMHLVWHDIADPEARHTPTRYQVAAVSPFNGGDMQIVMLTDTGSAIPVVQVIDQDASEICGPAFDPFFQRLYFSSQTGPSNGDGDGIVYEISRAV